MTVFDQILNECNAVIEEFADRDNLTDEERTELLKAYDERCRLFGELNSLAYAQLGASGVLPMP